MITLSDERIIEVVGFGGGREAEFVLYVLNVSVVPLGNKCAVASQCVTAERAAKSDLVAWLAPEDTLRQFERGLDFVMG